MIKAYTGYTDKLTDEQIVALLRAGDRMDDAWAYKQLSGIAGMIEGDDCRIPEGVAHGIEVTKKACEKAAPTAGMDSDEDEDEPYDDSQDHDPCPECHGTKFPGRDVVDPSRTCPRCDGASWV
jgi:hypothetical protein